VADVLRSEEFPRQNFGVPLAGSLIPYIDRQLDNGQSREEWKGQAETTRSSAVARSRSPSTASACGSERCAATARPHHPPEERHPPGRDRGDDRGGNDWVRLVPNDRESSIRELTPTAVTGRLHVPIGRIRRMNLGPKYVTAFTVGDQLLWGAAEPLRRMLRILLGARADRRADPP